MRQLFVFLFVVLLSGAIFAAPCVAAKIKHRDTVYKDSVDLSLKQPEGVGCSDGYFVVADTGNSQLVRYSMTPQALTPESVFPLPEASPIIAQVSSKGEIYVLDGKSRTIIKISQEGQVTGKLKPKGLTGSKTFIPRSFKLDKDDNIYLLDIFSERVLVLNPAEEYVKHIDFPEGYKSFSDLAISQQGRLYLLDGVAGALYVANPSSKSFELFSSGLKEHMNFPTSLALDSHGTLYLSDQNGSGLALVGPDGSFLGRKFGMGWEDGQFYYPSQVCINDRDTLIIADKNNNRVQVFNILED